MRHRPDRPCLPGRQADPTQAGVQGDQLRIHEDTPAEPTSLRTYEAPATAYTPAEAETRKFQRSLGNAGTSLKILKTPAFKKKKKNQQRAKDISILLHLYFAKEAIKRPLKAIAPSAPRAVIYLLETLL